MFFSQSTKTIASEAIQLIEDAKNAELCRDLPASRKILSPVWPNIDEEPRIEGLEPFLQAEILRLCGFYLGFYGRSRNLKNYQEAGKNFLTKAINIFDREGLEHLSAEAKVILALCYWHEGAIAESETILAETEAEYENNQLHPVYIQICVNRLMIYYWKEDTQSAVRMIEELATPIRYCKDARLKTMYHNQAGIVNRVIGNIDQSIFHFNEAIKTDRRAGNLRFCAVNLNNLGNACKDLGDFAGAHKYVDEAAGFYSDLQEIGWLAHVLDTKAQIYKEEMKFATALETVDQALEIFRQGEDYAGLVESLYTKCCVLMCLNKTTEAIALLVELTTIAGHRIGEFAANKYIEKFAKQIYLLKQIPFPDELKSFKKSVITEHLRRADLRLTAAAESLGITHQNLSDILNKQMPEVYDEIGLRRRARRNPSEFNKKGGALDENFYKRITKITLKQSDMDFEDGLSMRDDSQYYTFVLSGSGVPNLKVHDDVIALVEKSKEAVGACVVVQNLETKDFHCGILESDAWTKILYFRDAEITRGAAPMFLGELKYYGRIVGYCRLEEAADSKIIFKPYP